MAEQLIGAMKHHPPQTRQRSRYVLASWVQGRDTQVL